MKKISSKDIEAFIKNYFDGRYPHQRLGQAFVNNFKIACDHSDVNKPCLFHDTNTARVISNIWQYAE